MSNLTYKIMSFMRTAEMPIGSGVLARFIEADRDAVQRAVPRLVAKGFLTRVEGQGYPKYTCTVEQFNRYLATAPVRAMAQMEQQPDNVISKKLKFLELVNRGVYQGNPVLNEIIADYRELRRRQAEIEVA
ncbi:MarR family transcriptional regulator [Burkholderia multivorans]|uniref:MarR family transcriptional regulator n=1 Tax=Burkholderia multivorans TaxID=87883 RepID=UPI001C21EBFA|nr:MarR family transcriptional regulator [Burkholderia multivorans]